MENTLISIVAGALASVAWDKWVGPRLDRRSRKAVFVKPIVQNESDNNKCKDKT